MDNLSFECSARDQFKNFATAAAGEPTFFDIVQNTMHCDLLPVRTAQPALLGMGENNLFQYREDVETKNQFWACANWD